MGGCLTCPVDERRVVKREKNAPHVDLIMFKIEWFGWEVARTLALWGGGGGFSTRQLYRPPQPNVVSLFLPDQQITGKAAKRAKTLRKCNHYGFKARNLDKWLFCRGQLSLTPNPTPNPALLGLPIF
jgi:hypothetical protein